MSRSVSADKSSPVHYKYNRQFLRSHIVYYLIKCSLKKSRINCCNRCKPFRSKTRTECHRMLLCYSYIKVSFRKFILNVIQACPVRHSCIYCNYLSVLFCKFCQSCTEYLRISSCSRFFDFDACQFVKWI